MSHHFRSSRLAVASLRLALVLVGGARRPCDRRRRRRAPRFYQDDPIAREPESQDASKAEPSEISRMYEMTYNLFVTAGYKPSGLRAKNINTIDEVPDSSWFTNRIGTRTDHRRGDHARADRRCATRSVALDADPGEDRRRASGLHREGRQGRNLVPRVRSAVLPGGATGCGRDRDEDLLGARLQPGGIVPVRRSIRRTSTSTRRPRFAGPPAKRTPFTQDDINDDPRARRSQQGRHVSRHRRPPASRQDSRRLPLRGHASRRSRTISSRTSTAASCARCASSARGPTSRTSRRPTRSTRSSPRTAATIVKHYLQDVGSTFGMCNDLHEWDLSWEHFYQGDTMRKRLFSFGFALSPWQTVKYSRVPVDRQVRRRRFDPRKWRPQTPTTAYMEMRDDDAFWAARRVGGVHRRADPGGRPHRRVQRSGGREVPRRRADQAPRTRSPASTSPP